MKIVAGMGSLDDYVDYVKAGADEVFIGYVPLKWQIRYGLTTPLNRREVCYYNVQIGSESEMEILADLVKQYRVPVSIAINGLHYAPEQFVLIKEIINDCRRLGFTSFIIADYALLIYLYQEKLAPEIRIHVSGEFGECNRFILRELGSLGISRLIFHRKVDLDDMRAIVQKGNRNLEYEAFFLNEMCHFHGGFCNSLHCDEMEPICRLPYRLSGPLTRRSFMQEEVVDSGKGCAKCSLWRLRDLGITHLKIVGRGAYSEEMIEDIRSAKEALSLLEASASESEYRERILSGSCSKACYYRLSEMWFQHKEM